MSATSPPSASAPQASAADLALARACCLLRPLTAARALDAAPPSAGAAFLAGIEASAAARVLGTMGLLPAARLLAELPVGDRHDLLLALDPPAAADVLRAATEEDRADSLACLAPAERAPLAALLAHGPDTLGAHVDPHALTLVRGTTVAEALERVRAQRGRRDDAVFVTGPDRALLGVLSVRTLVSEAPERRLEAVLQGPPEALPASAPVHAVWDHPAWLDATQVPVTDALGRFVGTVSRARLASAAQAASPPLDDSQRTASALAELYGVGTLAMLRWAASVLGDPSEVERRLP